MKCITIRGIYLYKDELIHIHQLLVYLSKFLEDNGAPRSFFKDYTKIGIGPHHIHKTKAEHKYAIFVLGKCISSVLAEHKVVPRSIEKKLENMAERCKIDIY